MTLSRLAAQLPKRMASGLPGRGAWMVFLQEILRRCPIRDLIWMTVLLLCLETIAIAVQSSVMPLTEYGASSPRFLARWMGMLALSAPLILLPIAACLGAAAAPPVSRFEQTQSMLLTRLTAMDICMGKLLAAIWPAITATLASCALMLVVQVAWRPLMPGTPQGYPAILMVHFVLLSAVVAVAAIAFVFALRRRPGRIWARGAGAGVAAALIGLSALFLLNPIVRRMNDPTRLIYALLLINPATASTAAVNMDALRLPWLYERTDAPEYRFEYPSPTLTAAIYLGAAVGAMQVAASRLRRAYR